jgi:hypothetical protein
MMDRKLRQTSIIEFFRKHGKEKGTRRFLEEFEIMKRQMYDANTKARKESEE